MRRCLALTIAAAAAIACGCSGLVGDVAAQHTPSPRGGSGKIQHIVIIVQENRTVDNLFNGLPGADTVTSGLDHNGHVVPFHIVKLESGRDICHDHTCWTQTYDGGKLDGFDLNHGDGNGPHYPYAMVDPAETTPYFTMAETYAFADRMFQSNSGPSYPAHQYLIAGQSQMVDENPVNPSQYDAWGCDSKPDTTTKILGPDGQDHPGPFPCFDYKTLGDTMDRAGVSWRYYAPTIGTSGAVWSAFDAIAHIRNGLDWKQNVISPESQVLADISAGTLAAVTWVVPNQHNSDHAGDGGRSGPDWVASIVNAIGTSPFWNSTAIFVTWDDWGGWYDHVPPQQLDQMGLGYRVPLVIVSPYARQHYVSHAQHEFGSIMKFTEETVALPSLGLIDQRADDLTDCFDFGQVPTAFTPIPQSLPRSYFLHQRPSNAPPDND